MKDSASTNFVRPGHEWIRQQTNKRETEREDLHQSDVNGNRYTTPVTPYLTLVGQIWEQR